MMRCTTLHIASDSTWHEANQRYLMAALGVVRATLECHIASGPHATAASRPVDAAHEALQHAAPGMSAPPALETLCAAFHLSPFERDVLLLCAGIELDGIFATLCATAQGDTQRLSPTFSLALAALPEAHWSALAPTAPLRYWRLVQVGVSSTLVTSPLRIDERVLHYLAGVHHLDEHLASFLCPVLPPADLVPSHRQVAERIAATWSEASRQACPLPVVQLCGAEAPGKRAIAAAACAMLHLDLYALPAQVLPAIPHELDTLTRLWEREAALNPSALLLDSEDISDGDAVRAGVTARFIDSVGGALIIASGERQRPRYRPLVTCDIQKPTWPEQRALWLHALEASQSQTACGHVERLVAQFDLSAMAIGAVCAQAVQGNGSAVGLDERLWDTCRAQSRTRLDDLAQRLERTAIWADLVLPESQMHTLREAASQVRQRLTVYEQWGFAARSSRGLGITALFTGPSGTGKTLAAEVLASELRLDLYRIDLSQVVSKYIGETEKNLKRVFDAAEESGAILLFDEADALFGKRSEVKDSHDRYANIEVSYLLQRMESYRGLAILTTNMKSALDTAFLRRIRFVVQFPFPDVAQRAEIWRRIFPVATPAEGLDVPRLAQLNVAGGNIRNIALNAAFLAADVSEPVRMAHLLRAARSEYAKLEKSLTDAEIRGWI